MEGASFARCPLRLGKPLVHGPSARVTRALAGKRANSVARPPLWGLGHYPDVNGHDRLLHDGRARGVAEAILWHGGEAAAARDRVAAMPAPDRAALIAFLGSL